MAKRIKMNQELNAVGRAQVQKDLLEAEHKESGVGSPSWWRHQAVKQIQAQYPGGSREREQALKVLFSQPLW